MERSRGSLAVVAVIAVASVGASACGSSSKSKTSASAPAAPSTPATPSTPGTTSTAPAGGFAAQFNALCQQANKASQGKNLVEVGQVIEGLLPKFEALNPPPNQQATYRQILSLERQVVAAAKKNDTATVNQLGQKSNALAKQLGAPACAS